MSSTKTPKVIVIDDDPAVRSVIVAAFERAGCETRWAVDGRSGVKLFNAEPAHLVVTDIVMPNQEGIETILQLKRRERPPKVIAISGGGRRGGQDFLVWASHLGADATLPKPFRTSELIEVARGLLERRTPPAEDTVFQTGGVSAAPDFKPNEPPDRPYSGTRSILKTGR